MAWSRLRAFLRARPFDAQARIRAGVGAEGGDGGEGAEGLSEPPPEGTPSDGMFGPVDEPPQPEDDEPPSGDGGPPPPEDWDDPGRPDPPNNPDREGQPAQEPEPQQYQQRRRSPEERAILNRWFPGATTERLREIRGILRNTRDALASARIDYVPARPAIGRSWDWWQLASALADGAPAATIYQNEEGAIVPAEDWYIAVFPPFVARPAYGATVITHEGFHYQNPENFYAHEGSSNAFCFEGFVAELTGLPFNVALVSGGCGR